jgi:hypothetical protein
MPNRPGNFLGEVVGDWMWTGPAGGWMSVDEPQQDAMEAFDD